MVWRSPSAGPNRAVPGQVRPGHVEVAQADRGQLPAVRRWCTRRWRVVDGELGRPVRCWWGGWGRPRVMGEVRPARRRWRRWRRTPAGARGGGGSRRAGAPRSRRCRASTSPGAATDSPTSERAAKWSTPSKAAPAVAASPRTPSAASATFGLRTKPGARRAPPSAVAGGEVVEHGRPRGPAERRCSAQTLPT